MGARRKDLNYSHDDSYLFDQSSIGVLVLSQDGIVIRSNELVAKYLNFEHCKLSGMSLFEILKPKITSDLENFKLNISDLFKSKLNNFTNEIELIKQDNSKINLSLNFFAPQLMSTNDSYVIGFFQDITLYKRKEAELVESKRKAEEIVEEKSKFLANMSHEIRTPLNSLIGLTDVLLSSQLSDEQKKLLRVANAAGENLLHLINDILDLSKIEYGEMKLEKIPFFLTEQVENSISMFQLQAQEKKIKINWSIDSAVSNSVLGDPTRLRQILINLVGNAIKFSDGGIISISIEKSNNQLEKNKIQFSVSDQGIGIPPDKTKTIFETFKQVDSSFARKYGGSGLGLAISKKIVELMKGEIWVESELGKGSVFNFTIELEPALILNQSNRLSSLKFLVFSENKIIRSRIESLLLSEDAEVIEIGSIDEFLDHYKKSKFDEFNFIIFDHNICSHEFHSRQEINEIFKNSNFMHKMFFIYDDEMEQIKNHGGDNCKGTAIPLKKNFIIEKVKSTIESEKIKNSALVSSKKKKLKILVAEDVEDNRLLIQIYLKEQTHQIIMVENGIEALNYFKKENFDLVLMDVQMPLMDGYEATKAIRQWESANQRNKTPIIALTAHAFNEHIQASVDAGCTEHVTKPLKKAGLLKLIEKYS